MFKILSDPDFIKLKKTIESCETFEQLVIGINYSDLICKKIVKKVPISKFYETVLSLYECRNQLIVKQKNILKGE